jgi:hypothetical protein
MFSTFSLLCFAEGMTVREKLFVVVAWLPKGNTSIRCYDRNEAADAVDIWTLIPILYLGTVQAALGPVALETALSFNSGPEVEDMAYKVLSLSVMTIILVSVFGASMVLLLGSRLLKR